MTDYKSPPLKITNELSCVSAERAKAIADVIEAARTINKRLESGEDIHGTECQVCGDDVKAFQQAFKRLDNLK